MAVDRTCMRVLMRSLRGRPTRISVATALITALAAAVAPANGASTHAAARMPEVTRAAVGEPDQTLGADWHTSQDVLVTGAGDATGYHLYVAREKDAFAWSTLATLRSSDLDLGVWGGQTCVTGSGRYAVAVFAPTMAANKPALMEAGGLAAVLDIATGRARTVATGVQLAYFDPACGPGDRVLLTRAVGADEQKTDLLAVDAATATVTSVRRVNAQLTTPVPAPDGDYGIAHAQLVRVSASGATQAVARPHGVAYALSATAHNGIDILSGQGTQAYAERFNGGTLRSTGTGPIDRLQLFGLPGGQNVLVGDTSAISHGVPALSTLSDDGSVQAVSARGHLLVEHMLSRAVVQGVSSPFAGGDAKDALVDVTVRATRTGQATSGTIETGQAPTLNVSLSESPGTREGPAAITPADVGTPTCAVPRNDPTIQVPQPSANMVEWAVDQAVHGRLAVQQSTLPLHSIAGGGTVPAQVMLGVLTQESGLSQASTHAVPGDTGNPLVSDYYGERQPDGSIDIDVINYPKADCGYGLGQVTTGMHTTDTVYSYATQLAIATDYQANIAAAVDILIDKWNQLYTDPGGPTTVNNANANDIENWYFALWAYNSGFYPSSDVNLHGGNWGVGWLNNPANPVYPYSRHRYMEGTTDPATPWQWSYEEKVMGWIEVPPYQGDNRAYATPNFGRGVLLYLPNNTPPWPDWFCSTNNDCDPFAQPPQDPCPAESNACWWHGHIDFAQGCASGCSTERLTYGAGSSVPALTRVYPRSCDDIDIGQDQYIKSGAVPIIVVYDLNNTGQYALGCATHPSSGKFTLRVGSPANGSDSPYGQIDLHQLGAGYQGHIWFTHVYPPDYLDGNTNAKHEVVGTWSPDLPGSGRYDIVAHLPSHGAEYGSATYVIQNKPTDEATQEVCHIDQSTTDGQDTWVYLGARELDPGALVMLNNIGDSNDDGTTDIAFDAMAFIPVQPNTGHACRDGF